jgi:non-heme chloroperoxidase
VSDRRAIHLGHSTGGGEATRFVARHGKGRVAKLVLVGAVPPLAGVRPLKPPQERELLPAVGRQVLVERQE